MKIMEMQTQDNGEQKSPKKILSLPFKLTPRAWASALLIVLLIVSAIIVGRLILNRANPNGAEAETKKTADYSFSVMKGKKSISEASEGTKLSIVIHSKIKTPIKDIRIAFDGVYQKPSITKINKRGNITILKAKACCDDETHSIKIRAVNSKGKKINVKHISGKTILDFKLNPFSKIAEVNNVKSYGVKGDGVKDDTQAFQRAIDSTKGILTVPAGRYKITKPLFMKSYVRLHGVPGKSVIVQGGSDSESPFAMVLGDSFPHNYDSRRPEREQFKTFETAESSWVKGSSTISLKTPGDAKKLNKGEIICIRTTKTFDNDHGFTQPDFVQFNRIKKIEGNRLTLADKALNSIGDSQGGPPKICKIAGINPWLSYVIGRHTPWYVAKWAELSGITFEEGRGGLGAGFCYGCLVKDVEFRGVDQPIVLNNVVKSTFTRIKGDYSTEAIEVAMASTQTVYRDIDFTYRPLSCSYRSQPDPLKCRPPEASTKRPVHCSEAAYPDPTKCPLVGSPAIAVGERSVDITFDKINLRVGRNARLPARLIGIGDAQRISFTNSNLSIDGGGNQQIFEFRGNFNSAGPSDPSKSDFETKDYVIANNKINLGVQKDELAIIVGNEKNWIKNLQFRNNKWTGARTTNGTAYWAGNYVKDWAVINESIPIATHFRVTKDATHFNEDPVTQNVTFGSRR